MNNLVVSNNVRMDQSCHNVDLLLKDTPLLGPHICITYLFARVYLTRTDVLNSINLSITAGPAKANYSVCIVYQMLVVH